MTPHSNNPRNPAQRENTKDTREKYQINFKGKPIRITDFVS